MRRHSINVAAEAADPARGKRIKAIYRVEGRRLSGTIWPDQGMYGACLDVHIKLVEGYKSTEADSDIRKRQRMKIIGHGRLDMKRSPTSPTTPDGKNIMQQMRIAPYANSCQIKRSAIVTRISSGKIPMMIVPMSAPEMVPRPPTDRKSTRLNSSHANISYAVFCLKTKNFIFAAFDPTEPPWLVSLTFFFCAT